MALIMVYTKFKFMHGYEPVLEGSGRKTQMFRYFTVQSDTVAAIVSFLFAVKEIQLLRGKKEKIPTQYYILKMTVTAAVGLTFFVVFGIMGFVLASGHISLMQNTNLFFHLVIPTICMINFIAFERTDAIKFRHILYGLIPTAVYEIYYTVNLLINMENGQVSPKHDWYQFVQSGLWAAIIVAPTMLGITYIISLIIWKSNKIRAKSMLN